MTKSLTEQWKDGELEDGYYYVVEKWSGKIEINDYYDGCWQDLKEEYIKEVLAPVPSYAELTLIAGNCRLAKKSLRDCYNEMKYWATMNHRCSKIFNHIKDALVEIEEVK